MKCNKCNSEIYYAGDMLVMCTNIWCGWWALTNKPLSLKECYFSCTQTGNDKCRILGTHEDWEFCKKAMLACGEDKLNYFDHSMTCGAYEI